MRHPGMTHDAENILTKIEQAALGLVQLYN